MIWEEETGKEQPFKINQGNTYETSSQQIASGLASVPAAPQTRRKQPTDIDQGNVREASS
jgi:hypothetical protein